MEEIRRAKEDKRQLKDQEDEYDIDFEGDPDEQQAEGFDGDEYKDEEY